MPVSYLAEWLVKKLGVSVKIKFSVLSVFFLSFILTACSSPPKLKEPKGELFPINSSEVVK